MLWLQVYLETVTLCCHNWQTLLLNTKNLLELTLLTYLTNSNFIFLSISILCRQLWQFDIIVICIGLGWPWPVTSVFKYIHEEHLLSNIQHHTAANSTNKQLSRTCNDNKYVDMFSHQMLNKNFYNRLKRLKLKYSNSSVRFLSTNVCKELEKYTYTGQTENLTRNFEKKLVKSTLHSSTIPTVLKC